MTEFIVAAHPRFQWPMLWPIPRRELSFPFNAASTHDVFWGRSAIYHGLRALAIGPGQAVLVPGFHCSSIVEPILRAGAKAVFYNVHRDCSADFDDMTSRIDRNTRAVVAIHYFGFPQAIQLFREFCTRHGLYLIEDCAHVLIGELDGGHLGSFGDISIFSWRKFLPVYDGGQLVVNNPRLTVDIPWENETFLFTVKTVKDLLDRVVDGSQGSSGKHLAHLWRFPTMICRYFLSQVRREHQALAVKNYGVECELAVVNLRMSALSRYILKNSDLESIREERRFNYSYLLEAAKGVQGVTPLYCDLPDGICPYAFPFWVEGRNDIHLALRSRGIPAFTWGGVVHAGFPVADFPDAEFLFRQLVFLPVHHDLRRHELDLIRNALEEAVSRDP